LQITPTELSDLFEILQARGRPSADAPTVEESPEPAEDDDAKRLMAAISHLDQRIRAVEERPPTPVEAPLPSPEQPFSTTMLKELIDNMDEAVICVDPHGEILLSNRQAKILGLVTTTDRGEHLSGLTEEKIDGPPDDFATWDSLVEQVTVTTGRGQRLAMTKKTAPIQNDRGQTVAFAHIYRDMTKENLLREEQLRTSKLETLEMIAGGIAHDINNMLTSILANLSLVVPPRTERDPLVWHPNGSAKPPSSKAPESPSTCEIDKDLLDDVRSAALQCAELTKQLLGFAKQQHNTLEVCSLLDLVRDTVGFTMRGSVCSWNLEADDDLPMVEVNRVQISRVVQNLLINACESMPDGGEVSIEVRSARGPEPSSRRQRAVRVSIRDHGCGMDSAHLARIFDPHFSSKPDGHGLGLAVSYAIVRHHDGMLSAESKPGEHTVFHIDLPASTASQALPAPISADEAELRRLTGRVLLVESDTQVLESIGRLLTRIGLEVSYARDGHQALALFEDAKARGSSYSAAILDLALQGDLSADQTLDRLKRVDPELRAVASTNYAVEDQEPQLAGFCATLSKPYDLANLGSTLDAVLNDAN